MKQTDDNINANTLRGLFQKNADIKFQTYDFANYKVLFVNCDSMIDVKLLNEMIVPRVQKLCEERDKNNKLKDEISNKLHLPELKEVTSKEKLITEVFKGFLLLYFEEDNLLYTCNIADKPNRKPEESQIEVEIKGPRDNFIEDLSTNIALIRKRLPTNSLAIEKFELGRRSKTSVALMYMDDIANEEILDELRERIKQVDIDIISSGELLMEVVNKTSPFIPRDDYTARPDYAVHALVRGRFVVIVDGTTYAIITPVNLLLLLKTGEDNEYPIAFSSAERVLRVLGLVIGLALPAFWLAITSFHQEQLPFQLLATIYQNNSGIPLPTVLEMFLMLIMFELFREAGLRLPSVVGGTISVVGGIVVGDAAIRAGLTSPAMVVIIAISTISTFTLVNQSLVTSVSIIRIMIILVTSFFGFFGFFISLYAVLLYLANMRIFGVPYLSVGTNLNIPKLKKSFFRVSTKNYLERPDSLKPQDQTRGEDSSAN